MKVIHRQMTLLHHKCNKWARPVCYLIYSGVCENAGRHFIRITPDFSVETMKARRLWSSVMHTLRDHGCQPRLLYPAKLSITIEGQNKIFYDKTRFNQYLATNPVLHKVLEGKFQPKEVDYIHKNTDNR